MHASILSILPFVVIIPIALITRQVIPGLVSGLLLGAYLLTPSWLGGVDTALHYLYSEITVTGNLHLIVFLWAFGALVGLMQATGGVAGFARMLQPRIHSERSAFGVAWLSSFATFMAPDFRIITVAPVLRPVAERFHIKPERLAYVIDVTATPLIALVPIGTAFVGYMVGLITVGLRHLGRTDPAFPFFLSTIPLNFFAIAILLIGVYVSFIHIRQPKMRRTPFSPADDQALDADGATVDGSAAVLEGATSVPASAAGPKPDASNLIVPIAVLLALMFFLLWWSGHSYSSNLFQVLLHADAARAMLQAILITLVFSVTYYALKRQSFDRLTLGILDGGNEMMPVIVLLVLVWAVSGTATALGFTPYVTRTVGSALPSYLIAPGLFVIGSVISYFVGSSFGTWGILMPLGFSLAQSAHASLPLVAGAVFASGTLGGFASPLSDNTVAMATVMKLPVMSFARSLLKSTLVAGAVATAGYALAGMVM